MTAGTYWRDHEVRRHDGDHVTRECPVREGPRDKNSKVHYTTTMFRLPTLLIALSNCS